MKDYYIKEVDGHHIVRMLTDEEMKFKAAAEAFMQFVQNLYDTVREVVENLVTGIRAWIEENKIIELLEECENDKHSTEQSGYFIPAVATGETGHCDAGSVGD